MTNSHSHPSSFIVFVSTVSVLLTVSAASSCPSQCTCNTAAKSTICSSAAGPTSLPAGLSADTENLAIKGSYSRSVQFDHLRKSDLDVFPNLKTLIISHTMLKTIDKDAFSGVKNLKTLDLSFNHIQKLEAGVFDGLASLHFLQLTGNTGCELQPGVFQGLPGLMELYMGSMGLQTISSTLFVGLDSLGTLDLSDNDLEVVPIDFMFPTVFQSLKLLDLSFNRLKGLSHMLEPFVQRIEKIKLADNPWHCSCTLLWLKNYPQHIYPKNRHDTIICNSPDKVKYDSLAHLANQSLVCVPPATASCEEPVPVLEGETLHVKCKIGGDPVPDVTWTLPDGSTVKGSGDTGRGVMVNVTGTTVELTVLVSLAWNGTLQIMFHNVAGISHSEVRITVWPITTTSTTTTTTTTTPSTTITTTTPSPTSTIPTTVPSTTPKPNDPIETTATPKPTIPVEKKSDKNEDNNSNGQKTIIFAAAAIGSMGLISAVVVGGVLYKYLTVVNKVKPMQVNEGTFENYFTNSKKPSTNTPHGDTRPVVISAWEP
ncbi:leucine-rich repeat-containing protein 4-like [Littorina saxatilis]|uniref:leucine-rich repeat-containing protein 4-like n=1 Tax=Littorina saxatilis TaxID=31220 RepID=UPI0038B431BF